MSIDQWVSILASAAGCLAAIAAYLAIWQSSKQREASYRPEFVIERTEFVFGHIDSNPENFQRGELLNKVDRDEKGAVDHGVSGPEFLRVPLTNIGLGAAKWVEIEWNFPVEKLAQEINKKSNGQSGEDFFRYKNGTLEIVHSKAQNALCLWKNQKKEKIVTVIPVGIDQSATQLIVPPAFSLLVSAWVALSVRDPGRNSLSDIPPLEVEIRYQDIGGKKHKASLKLFTEILWVAKEGAFFTGYLDWEKRA